MGHGLYLARTHLPIASGKLLVRAFCDSRSSSKAVSEAMPEGMLPPIEFLSAINLGSFNASRAALMGTHEKLLFLRKLEKAVGV